MLQFHPIPFFCHEIMSVKFEEYCIPEGVITGM